MGGLYRLLFFIPIFITLNIGLSAQPANDDCSGAYEVVISDSEENIVLTEGDTRGATASTIPGDVCAVLWSTDDIFFKFTTPSFVPLKGIIIKAFFDKLVQPTDVPAIGMALYENCDSIQSPLLCFNSNDPVDNYLEVSGFCLETNHTYFIRIWSTGPDFNTEGTLRLGVYINRPKERILWWETFGGGIEANGWTTYGTCAIQDSNYNAEFAYLPDGIIDKGAYASSGQAIHGLSFCDGAVGVDSDFNDNTGSPHIFGSGPCPTPGQKFLISPIIYSGDWNVRGLTLTWIQSIRQYQSTFFVSYRYRDDGDDWSNWTDRKVNQEFMINSSLFEDNLQHHFLPGANGHDSLQIRFIYNDNYYFWAIDDVKLIETKCSDGRIVPENSAFTPFQQIPENQVFPFPASMKVFNAGACPMSTASLNLKIMNSQTSEIVYDETVNYNVVRPDTFAEYKFFPKLVTLPKIIANYIAFYTLTHDSLDTYPADDTLTYKFSVGGNVFGLENGFTGFHTTQTIFGDPASYAFGNYFRPESNVMANYITWGFANPVEVTNESVNINLIQWTDTNNDQIAQSNERKIIGQKIYVFSGKETNPVFFNTTLENIEHPGAPVIMHAGLGYMAIIEYNSSSLYGPIFNLLINKTQNYTPIQSAMDSAFSQGLSDNHIYFSVYGYSFDGNLSDIDYEVKELNPNDTRIFPGNDIVPLVRIVVSNPDTTNTNNELSLDNKITVNPNPASDEIYVRMEFIKNYQEIHLRLLNNIGQIVFTKTLSTTLTEHIEPININNLAVGNYMFQVETVDGQRSLPVIVVR